jgi:MFS family permease
MEMIEDQMEGFFSKTRIIASPHFNRWWVALSSIGIHLCIGSVYAWSIYNPALTRLLGVVAPSAKDWTLSEVTWIFSVAIVFLGLSAAFAGRWLEQVGPRKVGFVAALAWGGGYLIGYVGITTHQLWLLYVGYGVIGGCGLGLGYVSPVSTLLRWFPDRRGMATGLAIMGFGGGAIIAAPLKRELMEYFSVKPQHLGSTDEVTLLTEAGRRYAELGGIKLEVVVDAQQVFVVGSGSTGVSSTFLVLGLLYMGVMLVSALAYRIPPENWIPPIIATQQSSSDTGPTKKLTQKPLFSPNRMISLANVDVDEALRTPQFYLLWVVLCMNVTAGIGVLGIASTMMSEIFSSALPGIVDGAFAATYVSMISIFNMIGRFFWASTSDYIGRKTTYWIFFALGILLYLSVPLAATMVASQHAIMWLIFFYIATMLIFTMYGGGFATIPAYLADVFGTRYVGAIHGRLLTAWSVAGVLGPLAITSLREQALNKAIVELAGKVAPERFLATFGAEMDQLSALIEAKTVNIQSLLVLMPPGTADPTSGLYNNTMLLMACLLLVGLLANALMRPVDSKHHLS